MTVTVVAGVAGVTAVLLVVYAMRAPRRERPRPIAVTRAVTDRPLADRVAGLMRSGGWTRVTVTAAMGRLGTDVTGVSADGRRWLMRCHRDPARLGPSDVQRFADTVRYLQRGDLAMLVTAGPVAAPIREAALRAGITLVDSEGLAWWAAVQNPRLRQGHHAR